MLAVDVASAAVRGLALAAADGGTGDQNGSYLVDDGGDGGGTLLFVLVPLLLGVVFGWLARRRIFGVTVTLVGVLGFAITWALANHTGGIHTGGNSAFDDLGDALLTVIVVASLLLAFGLVGLLGLGAIAGSFLRSAISPAAEHEPPPSTGP